MSTNPRLTLAAVGLGSCVAVVLWDAAGTHGPVGAMAHVALPESGRDAGGSWSLSAADRSVPALVRRFQAAGGTLRNGGVALVGGALTEGPTPTPSGSPAESATAPSGRIRRDLFQVGRRNAEACRNQLASLGIRPAWQRLGGNAWRSVRLRLADGCLSVREPEGELVLWPAQPRQGPELFGLPIAPPPDAWPTPPTTEPSA